MPEVKVDVDGFNDMLRILKAFYEADFNGRPPTPKLIMETQHLLRRYGYQV